MSLNYQNDINSENIFIAFKLLNKLKIRCDEEYISNGIILYYLATKIVSFKQLSLLNIINLITIFTKTKSLTTKELINKINNILRDIDWDIDEPTLYNNIYYSYDTNYVKTSHISKKIDYMYLIMSFVIMSDIKYDYFSVKYCHEIIMTILSFVNNDRVKLNCKITYQMQNMMKELIMTINKINIDDNIGLLINKYIIKNNYNLSDFLEKIKLIDVKDLTDLIDKN